MSRFIQIRHKCFHCGCDLGFIDNIGQKNYTYFKGKYYCNDCREDLVSRFNSLCAQP